MNYKQFKNLKQVENYLISNKIKYVKTNECSNINELRTENGLVRIYYNNGIKVLKMKRLAVITINDKIKAFNIHEQIYNI